MFWFLAGRRQTLQADEGANGAVWLYLIFPNAKDIRLFRKILMSMGKDRLKQACTHVFRPTATWTRSRECMETVKGELYLGKILVLLPALSTSFLKKSLPPQPFFFSHQGKHAQPSKS